MCDYSLAHFPNRLAVEGERLRVHRFSTRTLGMAPARRRLSQILFPETTPAVCIPHGARLQLRDIPEHLRWQLKVGKIEEVTFVQQTAEAYRYRDAVRFNNGREIRLQLLDCGQRVVVLSLNPSEAPHAGPAETIERLRPAHRYK
jgi:hypothetical protein